MDIYKFTPPVKKEYYGVLMCVVLIYSRRKKNIQLK